MVSSMSSNGRRGSVLGSLYELGDLGKLLNLLEPQFFHLSYGENTKSHFFRLGENVSFAQFLLLPVLVQVRAYPELPGAQETLSKS